MSATQDGVRSTLSLIEDMALPHPSGRLLSTFITEALNPSFAAAYAREKLSAGECDLLLSGWTHIIESSMFLLLDHFVFVLSVASFKQW